MLDDLKPKGASSLREWKEAKPTWSLSKVKGEVVDKRPITGVLGSYTVLGDDRDFVHLRAIVKNVATTPDPPYSHHAFGYGAAEYPGDGYPGRYAHLNLLKLVDSKGDLLPCLFIGEKCKVLKGGIYAPQRGKGSGSWVKQDESYELDVYFGKPKTVRLETLRLWIIGASESDIEPAKLAE